MAVVEGFGAYASFWTQRARRGVEAMFRAESARAKDALEEAKRQTAGPAGHRPRGLGGLPFYRPTGALHGAVTTEERRGFLRTQHIITAPGVRSAWALVPGSRRPLAAEFWSRVTHRWRQSVKEIEAALRREEGR